MWKKFLTATIIFTLIILAINSSFANIIYISPTGNDTTGNGSQGNPYQTLSKAYSVAINGDTINLADGIYNLAGDVGLTINKDLTISGTTNDQQENNNGTIIDAINFQGNPGTIFMTLAQNRNINLQNIKFRNCSVANIATDTDINITSCISNYATTIINNCLFYANHKSVINFFPNPIAAGGAIANNATGVLRINQSSFLDNSTGGITGSQRGGAIWNFGVLNITNSLFKLNTTNINLSMINCVGGAISNYFSLTIDNSVFDQNSTIFAGAISSQNWLPPHANNSSLTVTNSKFTNNAATSNGGVISVDHLINIKSCDFENNLSGGFGGVFANYVPSIINFCRFYNNHAVVFDDVYLPNPVNADITNNWWADNNGPGGRINDQSVATPWLKFEFHPATYSVDFGGTVDLNATLTFNSAGIDTSSLGFVPNGIPVAFQNPSWGSFVNPNVTTFNGIASATYQANGPILLLPPFVNIAAILDGVIATTVVTIIPELTMLISATKNQVNIGEHFTVDFKLKNTSNHDITSSNTAVLTLPSDFKITNISGDGSWTISGNNIQWTITGIPFGEAKNLYVSGNLTDINNHSGRIFSTQNPVATLTILVPPIKSSFKNNHKSG